MTGKSGASLHYYCGIFFGADAWKKDGFFCTSNRCFKLRYRFFITAHEDPLVGYGYGAL